MEWKDARIPKLHALPTLMRALRLSYIHSLLEIEGAALPAKEVAQMHENHCNWIINQ